MTVRALVVTVLGLTVAAGVGAVASAQNKPNTLCTLAGKGTFEIGWVEAQKDQRFRCVATFDQALQRSGVTWVRVDADGKVIVP
jgi:hypothetical protein